MNNHLLWMLLACVAPLLLIFLLPFFGVTPDLPFFLFLIVFFVAHLFMMRGHSRGHGNSHRQADQEGQPTKHSRH